MTRTVLSTTLLAFVLAASLSERPAFAQQPANAASGRTVRVVGTVRDQQNAIPLPGVPVTVVGAETTVYTDVDGRYEVDLPPGSYQLKVMMEGYRERLVSVDVVEGARPTVDVALSMAGFSENVTVAGQSLNAAASSAEAQLAERKNAQVITDNVGSQEMRANGDSDAAEAMQRVTGLSVVGNQYVFVRGLGERYSNTTLGGAVIPTTEPDKKVVPLDLFPTALVDSVQVAKSYSPDKSAEFAGGLVQIIPLKFPSRPMLDVGYGLEFYSTATGKSILESPINGRDWLGYDNGARALPASFPDSKIVRRGIFTPDVGYYAGRDHDLRPRPRQPVAAGGKGRPGRPELVGGLRQPLRQARHHRQRAALLQGELHRRDPAVLSHRRKPASSKPSATTTSRPASPARAARHRRQRGLPVLTRAPAVGRELLLAHGPRRRPLLPGRQHGEPVRVPELPAAVRRGGPAVERRLRRALLRRPRQQPRRLAPDRRAGQPRRARLARDVSTPAAAERSTADLRPLADESQSGFRMFSTLDDDSIDGAANWSLFSTAGGRPTH